MTRVCIVRQTYYPKHRNLRRNAETLLSQGYEVDVLCLRQKGQKAREVMNGVNIYRLPLEHRRESALRYVFEYAAFFMLAFFTLGWLSMRRRYRVVEVDTMPDFLVFATLIPRLLGAKVVLFMYENIPQIFMDSYGVGEGHILARTLRLIERASAAYATRVIVSDGPLYKQVLESHGVPGNKISVVLNVPDETVFSTVGTFSQNGKHFRLIVLSNLLPRYGVTTVVKAIPLMARAIPELQVDVVGAGESQPQLESLARDLHAERYLNFTGWVSQESVPGYVSLADVAVAPMLHDVGLPNKIFDYFAMAKPCVVSALPSLVSTFDESCVLFFKPGDEKELATRVLQLHRDPGKRASLGARGRSFYDSVRWEVMRNEYLGVYEKCLNA